jgi:hypothetical protein
VKKEWALSREGFDALLAWLDPDRDRAGERYEIRLDLETLADEVINRVMRQSGVKGAWRDARSILWLEGREFILNYYPQERLQ